MHVDTIDSPSEALSMYTSVLFAFLFSLLPNPRYRNGCCRRDYSKTERRVCVDTSQRLCRYKQYLLQKGTGRRNLV